MAQVGNGIRAHSAPEAEVHLVIGIWYLVPLMCCSHCTSFSANLSCVRWKPEGANDELLAEQGHRLPPHLRVGGGVEAGRRGGGAAARGRL